MSDTSDNVSSDSTVDPSFHNSLTPTHTLLRKARIVRWTYFSQLSLLDIYKIDYWNEKSFQPGKHFRLYRSHI